MASIISLGGTKNGSISVIRDRSQPIKATNFNFYSDTLSATTLKFYRFWELMDTIERHGYLRAAMSTIGRSAVGAWWNIRQNPDYPNPSDLQRRKLQNFYMMKSRSWDNIKDFHTFAYKLMIGVMYLRWFGHAGYYIVRDSEGRAIGLDFIPGLLIPNVDSAGKFKPNAPAFVQFPTANPSDAIYFNSQRDIVYLINPDWQGSHMGGSDIQALSDLTLPIDLYLQIAAREYLKNRDKPEVVYEVSPDLSAEAFDDFVREMEARRGSTTLGRNPIAVQGDFKVHELRPYPDALPYQQSRKESTQEELAVAGVSGAKLGFPEDSGNLREMRREFHESSMIPIFRLVELSFYEQIHLREFNFPGWEFKFNHPDFLTAVERATVHMRYHDMSVLSPNEIRADIGKTPRKDAGGDSYSERRPSNQQGSPPEGREQEPDAPSQIGEPTLDDQDPPRGDNHDEDRDAREAWLGELRQWKKFALSRLGKTSRKFQPKDLPDDVVSIIDAYLLGADTPEMVASIFNDAMSVIREERDE